MDLEWICINESQVNSNSHQCWSLVFCFVLFCFLVPESPVRLVVIQVAQHFWFLRSQSGNLSRNQRLAYRKDYIAKHMLATVGKLVLFKPHKWNFCILEPYQTRLGCVQMQSSKEFMKNIDFSSSAEWFKSRIFHIGIKVNNVDNWVY